MGIGDRLKAERVRAGLTLEQAGAVVGKSKQAISQIERGVTKNPEAATLEPLARHLGVSLQWLMTGKGSREAAAAPAAPSQLQRPDPVILIETLDFLEKAYGGLGKEFSLRVDADLFADAYEWFVEDDRPIDERNLVHFAEWRAKHQAAKAGGSDEEQDRSIVGEVARADRRRTAG